MIELSGVTVRYGGAVAVEDVTFTAQSGEVTGLIGPNGAGKSTTLRLIAGLEHPASGTVTIDGLLYADLPNPGSAIGVLLDAGWASPTRTAREHLRWMAAAIGLPGDRVIAALELVGLQDVADRPVGGFSLGMRQRLAIAGAVLGDPPVIVLDEPVNGLDPEAIAWIRRTLRALADEGRTVLLSSHLLSELEQTADRIVALHEGRVVADAPLAELIEPAPPGRSGLEELYFRLTGDDGADTPARAEAPARPPGVVRRSVAAESRKSLTSRGFRAALGGALGAALAVAVVVGVFSPVFRDASVTTAAYGAGLVGGALIVVAGTLLIGLDREHGTLALTRILLPRSLLGYGAKALVAGVSGAATGLLSAVLAIVIALVTGLASPGREVLHLLISIPVAGVLLAVLGLAVGHLVPSTTAAVGVVLGWWFLVEAIAVPALPFGRALAAWLPATSAQFGTIGVPAHTAAWSPWISVAILAAWTAVLSAIAAVRERRA
ncbi:ATP-binding cassette domain-containing protein [Tsukamurella sputi]|uniref:ATP-binding cassette domain-containing protein n=1 Tax=Tsukamurella sputi TaxID=2591848 RepID=UPI001878A028|nr:ATP-binding cassette domain-containing protein [Tsukamurella sputi]